MTVKTKRLQAASHPVVELEADVARQYAKLRSSLSSGGKRAKGMYIVGRGGSNSTTTGRIRTRGRKVRKPSSFTNAKIPPTSKRLLQRSAARRTSRSAVSRRKQGFSAISALAHSSPSWAGRTVERPTTIAVFHAKRLYATLIDCSMLPDRIMASGQGGIGFCFIKDDTYADLEVLNSGEFLASTEDRRTKELSVWEFDPKETLKTIARIRTFLDQHGQNPVR